MPMSKMILSLVIYLSRCLHGERNSIHKNLVFCLFVAEMLFLFGIDKTYNKVGHNADALFCRIDFYFTDVTS